MKKGVYSLLILSLLASPALAQEDTDAKVWGSFEAGFPIVDDDDHNSAKFTEFRDIDEYFFGGFDLNVQQGSTYLDFRGSHIGLDDPQLQFRGTDYRNFSYEFHFDKLPHNLSFDAKAPYTGIGGPDLGIDRSAVGSVDDWYTFDYSVDRKEFGGQVTITMDSPFYVTMGIQRRDQEGIKPLGSGSYWLNMEMPEPVDYTTDDITFQGGYRSKKLQARLTGFWSTFENANQYMTQPNTGEITTLPPENDYGKVAADLSWRGMPLHSMLAVRSSYARLDNDFSIDELNLAAPTGLNRNDFEGDITYTKGSVALSSRPTHDLDTRIYYNYLDKENDSSVIRYQDVRGNDISNEHHIFDYEKNNAGIDLDYDLARHTKLHAGYEYLDIDRRNRDDAEATTDHSIFLQAKNTSLDMLTAKLRYQRLERDSDYEGSSVRRYDATDKTMDEIRLILELYPMHRLDFGFEYAYKMNDYDETDLGRTEDERHELYADFVWRAADKITLSGFAGYEMTETDSSHMEDAAGTTADYNWSKERDDDYWTYGLALNLPDIIAKLSLDLSYQYQESDGEVNFSSQGPTLADIDEADDYDKQALEAKATYALKEDTAVTLGYLYEKYDYDDLQYDNYIYSQTGSYLTGAYNEQSYEANVGYFMVSYYF